MLVKLLGYQRFFFDDDKNEYAKIDVSFSGEEVQCASLIVRAEDALLDSLVVGAIYRLNCPQFVPNDGVVKHITVFLVPN